MPYSTTFRARVHQSRLWIRGVKLLLDLLRQPLVVVVEERQPASRRVIDREISGRCRSTRCTWSRHRTNPRVSDRTGNLKRPVGRTVINDDHFQLLVRLVAYRINRPAQCVLAVVARDHNSHQRIHRSQVSHDG